MNRCQASRWEDGRAGAGCMGLAAQPAPAMHPRACEQGWRGELWRAAWPVQPDCRPWHTRSLTCTPVAGGGRILFLGGAHTHRDGAQDAGGVGAGGAADRLGPGRNSPARVCGHFQRQRAAPRVEDLCPVLRRAPVWLLGRTGVRGVRSGWGEVWGGGRGRCWRLLGPDGARGCGGLPGPRGWVQASGDVSPQPGSCMRALDLHDMPFGSRKLPQLGDGRAICFGEVVNDRGEHWELQLKVRSRRRGGLGTVGQARLAAPASPCPADDGACPDRPAPTAPPRNAPRREPAKLRIRAWRTAGRCCGRRCVSTWPRRAWLRSAFPPPAR